MVLMEEDIVKQLRGMVAPAKAMDGEMAMMKGPTFVQVDVHFTDYDDRGIVIQGVITDVIADAGIADVIPVEEIEWLSGENE